MKYHVQPTTLTPSKSPCLLVGLFEDQPIPKIKHLANKTTLSYLKKLQDQKDLSSHLNATTILHQVPGAVCERLILVGCGPNNTVADKVFKEIALRSLKATLETGASEVLCFLTDIDVKTRDLRWKIQQIIRITEELCYQFDLYKSKPNQRLFNLQHITFSVPHHLLVMAKKAIVEGQAINEGVKLTKDLSNTPPNVCTPTYISKSAKKLSSEFRSIKTTILGQKSLSKLKMGALLSVAQGSKHEPQLITLQYQGRKDKQKPIVLIGKGITFDTGGNSLKSPLGMIGMKYDMCGAAAVLGTLKAAARLRLPLNIIGILACAENMPGNQASRPDDIVKTLSGITVEILNTDAEGRLVLCDALTYSKQFSPKAVIDIATLTGACTATFGGHVSALLSNHDNLAQSLFQAGLYSDDKCWQLPLWDEYQEAMNSNIADIANIGIPSEAGTILGACFLSRFIQDYPWAHLDIAGTASRNTGRDRGATGRPVPLLVQYLLECC